MNKAKDKNQILAEIRALTPLHQIAGLDLYLPELERDGLVEILPDEQSRPITIRLTKLGKSFLAGGGYKTARKAKRKTIVRRVLKWLLVVVIGGALTTAITIILTQMLTR